MNPFDLLVDDDNEDPNQLVSAQRSAPAVPSKKAPSLAQPAKPANLPSKPLPPAQAGGFCFLLLIVCLVFLFCNLFGCEVETMNFSIRSPIVFQLK